MLNDYAMLHCSRNSPVMIKNLSIMLKSMLKIIFIPIVVDKKAISVQLMTTYNNYCTIV